MELIAYVWITAARCSLLIDTEVICICKYFALDIWRTVNKPYSDYIKWKLVTKGAKSHYQYDVRTMHGMDDISLRKL